MPKVLVVGAGLTGAIVARRLRELLEPETDIECWEYLNDSGGRLATSGEQGIVADVATQYLSLDLHHKCVQELYKEIADAGLLRKVDEGILVDNNERPKGAEWSHYFAPAGTSSVVNFLLKRAKAEMKTNCCVDWCSLDAESWKWSVEASGGKGGGSRQKGMFDAVVLCNGPTHPGCERMDNIWGKWQDTVASDFWNALREVTWSSCYVITLFLKAECSQQCDRFFGDGVIYQAVNDELIHYICYESRKRTDLSGKNNSSVVLVCHTTAEAMWYYKRTQCVQAVQERVLRGYLQLPEQMASRVVRRAHSRCWGKSQVANSISDLLGSRTSHCICNPNDSPPLALCGDYFLGSTCTDAIVSATAAAEAISSALTHGVQSTAPGCVVSTSHFIPGSEQQEKKQNCNVVRRRWSRKVAA